MKKKLGKEDIPSASSLPLPARNDKGSVVFYETADSEAGGSQVGQLSDDLSVLLSQSCSWLSLWDEHGSSSRRHLQIEPC